MKKCPPGVICIENVTIIFIIICIVIVFYFIYSNAQKQNVIVNNKPSEKIVINREPGWFHNPTDVLLNPYSPPLRDERYSINYIPPGSIPINVATNSIDTNYRQVGILTPANGREKNNILPLMGRILFNRRDLWNYYTISNQHNNVKLPLLVKGKSALNDHGVDKVYSGDTVLVEGVNDAYKVTLYDSDTIRYLPF